jgi:hypothetical protein
MHTALALDTMGALLSNNLFHTLSFLSDIRASFPVINPNRYYTTVQELCGQQFILAYFYFYNI